MIDNCVSQASLQSFFCTQNNNCESWVSESMNLSLPYNRMTKLYSESSSQTVQIDPDHHVRNYKHLTCNINKSAEQDEIIDVANDVISHAPGSESLDQDEELQRRLHPSRRADFATLQSELLQWRCREEGKITKAARNAAHKREMIKLLLRKESHLIRKIDQLRNSATEKWKAEQIELMMEMMSKPKQWEDKNGFVIRVDTPETCRARLMKSMYSKLIDEVDDGKSIEIHLNHFTSCHNLTNVALILFIILLSRNENRTSRKNQGVD